MTRLIVAFVLIVGVAAPVASAKRRCCVRKPCCQATAPPPRPYPAALAELAPPKTITVTNCNDGGPGSLRQALLDVAAYRERIFNENQNPLPDRVLFDISEPLNDKGKHQISVLRRMPGSSWPLIIDGTSEPDYRPGKPVVDFRGQTKPDGSKHDVCFNFYGKNSELHGVEIWNFTYGVWLAQVNQIVEDCFIWSTHTGVLVTNNCRNCLVRNNRFENNYYSSVNLIYGASDNKVTGNTVTGGGTGVEVYAWKCKNNLIEGNTIRKTKSGINLFNQGVDNVVRKNMLEDNLAGIGFSTAEVNALVEENTLRRNVRGLVAGGGPPLSGTFRNNTITDSTEYGILLSAHQVQVTGNTISGTKLNGIYIVGGNQNNVSGNTITDGPGYGVWIAGQNNTGTGNTFARNVKGNVFVAPGFPGNDIK